MLTNSHTFLVHASRNRPFSPLSSSPNKAPTSTWFSCFHVTGLFSPLPSSPNRGLAPLLRYPPLLHCNQYRRFWKMGVGAPVRPPHLPPCPKHGHGQSGHVTFATIALSFKTVLIYGYYLSKVFINVNHSVQIQC